MEADIVSRGSRGRFQLIMVGIVLVAPPALGQSNLDAGKSPAQIFSDTCGVCHRSPRELKPSSAGFLREHYSTGGREAAAMAAYLASVGSDPRAVRERRPPTLGAGQAAAPTHTPGAGDPGHPTTTEPGKPVAAKPRRPSDSVEIGKLPVDVQPVPSQTAAAPAPPRPTEDIEE
jgi:hypothetical protein